MMVMMMETKRVTAAVVVVELRRIAQVFCRADESTSCSVHVPKDMDDNAAPLTLPFVTSFYGELAQDSVSEARGRGTCVLQVEITEGLQGSPVAA